MALAKPRKRRLIIIIIIVANRVQADLDNDIEATLYEDISCQLSHFQLSMWDSDEQNWTAEEVDAWAAFEDLASRLESDIEDLSKIEPLSEAFGAALSAL